MYIAKGKKSAMRHPVRAADEVAPVEVAPEATDLLFEAEDVADLVAEVTGEDVAVEADENTATFTIGEDTYTVEAEGDEELVESSTRTLKSRKVTASRQARRPISNGRVIRRK